MGLDKHTRAGAYKFKEYRNGTPDKRRSLAPLRTTEFCSELCTHHTALLFLSKAAVPVEKGRWPAYPQKDEVAFEAFAFDDRSRLQ
jgi:hypothetical protein